jgi:hypothetical protein
MHTVYCNDGVVYKFGFVFLVKSNIPTTNLYGIYTKLRTSLLVGNIFLFTKATLIKVNWEALGRVYSRGIKNIESWMQSNNVRTFTQTRIQYTRQINPRRIWYMKALHRKENSLICVMHGSYLQELVQY